MAVTEDVNCVYLLWPYTATFPKAPSLLRQYIDITKDWIKQLRNADRIVQLILKNIAYVLLLHCQRVIIDQETCSIAIWKSKKARDIFC